VVDFAHGIPELPFRPSSLAIAAQEAARPAEIPADTTMADQLAVPEIVKGRAKHIIRDFNAALAIMAPNPVVRTPNIGSARMEW
jgi:hypothetical protein